MKKLKATKILLIIAVVLLIVQIPWYLVIQAIVDKTQTRTTATVIRIISNPAGCTGDTATRPDSTCDHSRRLVPVYQYFDQSGKRYEQDDRFFGEYKKNNPLIKIFGKEVGDKVTAYYTKDKPQEVLFMSGPFAYTAWLIPLYLEVPVLITGGILFILYRLKK